MTAQHDDSPKFQHPEDEAQRMLAKPPAETSMNLGCLQEDVETHLAQCNNTLCGYPQSVCKAEKFENRVRCYVISLIASR